MSINWKLIYTDSDIQRISYLRGLLEENNIAAQVINKIDSVYPSIGSAELYVDSQFTEQALNLIKSKDEGQD
ncbi:MAG: DUF2007 domain-containing protein [Bacteroidia bacterium]